MAQALNRCELIRNIKPFMEFLLTLRRDKPIPILRDLAVLVTDTGTEDRTPLFLKGKIDRIYLRLCRLQEELSGLDFKKAAPGTSPEDYIFSRINFSRYREIPETDFEYLFLEGTSDFPAEFFNKNFAPGRDGACALIKECYAKKDKTYRLRRENPVILSVMRALEISLENSPLFTVEEIQSELDFLQGLTGTQKKMPDAQMLFSLLILSLENIDITHNDGMVTKLTVSPRGGLSGTFRPGGKAWTRALA